MYLINLKYNKGGRKSFNYILFETERLIRLNHLLFPSLVQEQPIHKDNNLLFGVWLQNCSIFPPPSFALWLFFEFFLCFVFV